MAARANMLLASTLAGMAFINASVGLVHAVAHALGGFFDIAHGTANAIMLPLVMRFSLIGNPGKYTDIAMAMGEDVEGLREMEETLNQTGAYPFNPRKVGKREVMQLFEQAFELSKN